MKEHDESKLPQYAQNELSRLRANITYLERKLNTGPESRVIADPYADVPRYLGNDTAVEFKLGDEYEQRITARIREGKLYLQGGGSIAIEPAASNTSFVRVITRS